MLSTEDLERLIALKKRELNTEKSVLGLETVQKSQENNERESPQTEDKISKNVKFDEKPKKIITTQPPSQKIPELSFTNSVDSEKRGKDVNNTDSTSDSVIPADLERYIRRYLGLPVMLKAGEYSPNNPVLRSQRDTSGDAFIGLGDYEQRVNTLRKIRQNEYREYLEQQAKKKQEEKAQLERERREEEARERARELYLSQLELERDRDIAERNSKIVRLDNFKSQHNLQPCYVNRVRDKMLTTTQGGARQSPVSVGVQTDESVYYDTIAAPPVSPKTRAERELSPRAGIEPVNSPPLSQRQSHGEYEDLSRQAHVSRESRCSYKPSLFDAEAIHIRNLKAQKDAAAKRSSYQQELKQQIEEQQRLREERKAREKMLEQAEMRRLEEQLRMLQRAQEHETNNNQQIIVNMKENARDFHKQKTTLQREIDRENQSLLQTRKSNHHSIKRLIQSKSQENNSYSFSNKDYNRKKKPFSSNIPANSIFSPTYDVDSYLRKNLNPSSQSLVSNGLNQAYKTSSSILSKSCLDLPRSYNYGNTKTLDNEYDCIERSNLNIPINSGVNVQENLEDRPKYEPSFLRKTIKELIVDTPDEIPIPVLRHSPTVKLDEPVISENTGDLHSDAMKKLEDRWKVPIVQKNILKTLPDPQGQGVNILTQLGSIRRQLQLEQLKLDRINKEKEVSK